MALTSGSRKQQQKGKPVTIRHNPHARMAALHSSDSIPLGMANHPFLRFSHMKKGLDPSEKILQADSEDEHIVKFNISGRSYTVLRKTLGRLTYANVNSHEQNNCAAATEDQGTATGTNEAALYKDMMCILCRFADPKTPRDDLIAVADGYFSDSREYFFERSQEAFESVLHFFRTGRLHPPANLCLEMFMEELRFWQLSPSLISQCCRRSAASRQFSRDSVRNIRNSMKCESSKVENKSPGSPVDPPEYSPRNSLINKDSGAIISTSYQDQHKQLDNSEGKEEEGGLESKLSDFEGVCLKKQRRAIWDFMEDPQSSKPAKIFSLVSVTVVLVSVLDLIVASLQDFQVQETHFSEPKPHPILMYIEQVCIIWFTMEYIVRLIIVKNRLAFIKAPLNIVDCLSVLPFYVELTLEVADIKTENLDNVKGALMVLRILRVLRVARIFKLAKYSGGLQSFGHTLKASYKEIWMLVLFMSITIVLFSTTVYFLEKDMDGTKFTSIPATFWWCIVTMTTVGYGDMYPGTLGGKLVASLTSVSGVIVLAFPITIIVENFNKYYRNDDELDEERSSMGDEEELMFSDVERRIFNV